MKLYKKILGIVIIIVMCFHYTFNYAVLAQEILESPTPAPTSTPEVITIENNADIVTSIDSTSNSGENAIETATPTPTPSELIEPEVVTEILETSSPEATSTPLPTASSDPTSEITTSDSVSTVDVENNVNSNVVNSEFIYHTLNIYLPETGDIDLSLLTSNIINKVYGVDNNLSETVNLKVTNIDNFSYIENNIESDANTGANTIATTGNAEVTTGNAYSVVSVLNNVNTNIIDSKIHLVTINIFGNLTGNILLPEFQNGLTGGLFQPNVFLSDNATVNNLVSSDANSGNNSITNSSENTATSEISTGEAGSVVNVVNLINTNFINTVFRYLYINTLGIWIGDFMGWMDSGLIEDSNLAINSSIPNPEVADNNCIDCSTNLVNIENNAVVSNNISSSANSGQNSITSTNGDTKINTGNAYSSVSLINLVNSNFINSQGFVGFINIFGTFRGNVGGASLFTKVEDPEIVVEEQQNPPQKESGGILESSHTNNVGTHVLPGDTVTFFAKIKNVGYGKIYNSKLKIELFKEGISYGASYFDLGDINSRKSLKFSTGLVMSKKAFSGIYTAKVTVTGIVGPNDTEISSSSESQFKILGFNTLLSNNNTNFPDTISAADVNTPQVLGTNSKALDPLIQKVIVIFTSLFLLFMSIKGYQNRKSIIAYAYRIGSLLT